MLVCTKRSLESVYAARSPNPLNMRLVLLDFMILSILVNIKASELKADMFWRFKESVGLQDLLPGIYFNPKCSKFG